MSEQRARETAGGYVDRTCPRACAKERDRERVRKGENERTRQRHSKRASERERPRAAMSLALARGPFAPLSHSPRRRGTSEQKPVAESDKRCEYARTHRSRQQRPCSAVRRSSVLAQEPPTEGMFSLSLCGRTSTHLSILQNPFIDNRSRCPPNCASRTRARRTIKTPGTAAAAAAAALGVPQQGLLQPAENLCALRFSSRCRSRCQRARSLWAPASPRR